MSIKSLNQTLSNAYATPDYGTKLLKANFIELCSDVDRYFRVTFNVDIYKKVTLNQFEKIQYIFPNFRHICLEQFNRLLFTFISIRDVNAHLYLRKKIYIDEDIETFIKNIINSPYSITSNKEATIFGCICVSFLFSQGYQLRTFETNAIRHNIFIEVPKSAMPDFQNKFHDMTRALVGNGKPTYPKQQSFFSKMDINNFNEEVRKNLTRLFFDLEKCSSRERKMANKVESINEMLDKFDCLKGNQELIVKITELRNTWLHGYRLFDNIKSIRGEYIFDLEYLFQLLLEMKDAFVKSGKHIEIVEDISEVGIGMIDFYTSRNLEVTYKIIDKNLFDEEKLSERVANSVRAYERCMVPDLSFYNGAKSLISTNEKEWYLAAGRFKDFIERTYVGEKLVVIEFESKNGFCIGETHIENNEMILFMIDLPKEEQLKINGKYLNEYVVQKHESYSFFDIYNIQL